MVQAWDFSCPSHAEKLVLLALCDNSNDEGVCWPSINTISRKCGLHRTNTMKAIDRLEKAGIIEVSNREYTSNIYHIFPQKDGGSSAALPVAPHYKGGSVALLGVVVQRDHNHQLNRQRTVSTYTEDALRIYQEYPRKVSKPQAIKAIVKAIKAGNDPNALIDLTKSYAAAVSKWPDEERKFVPHPATWFNNDRFNDDPKEWEKTTAKPEPRKWGEQPTPQDRALDDAMEKMRRIW